jgi:CHASE2 domain-containing sensor protein
LGNWPWARSVHARLVQRLTEAGVRGIGMDVTMAEPDVSHPENDRAYAEAIRRNGHVVMPVFAEAAELGGVLEEVLPTSDIAREASTLGHVDASKDPDGIARGVYLKAGLGQAQWPALALALFAQDQAGQAIALPGLRRPHGESYSPYQWVRDNYVLLRFASAAGAFNQVSYIDVLEGRVPDALLKGRWVLVGATAAGLGDQLATSASGINAPMPGVEYQANILESLRNHRLITPLNLPAQLLIGGLLLAAPLALLGWPWFQRRWRLATVTLLAIPLGSLLLLRLGYLWWPPGACLVVAALGVAAQATLAQFERRRAARAPPLAKTWWLDEAQPR